VSGMLLSVKLSGKGARLAVAGCLAIATIALGVVTNLMTAAPTWLNGFKLQRMVGRCSGCWLCSSSWPRSGLCAPTVHMVMGQTKG
jgi:hypothetical protein